MKTILFYSSNFKKIVEIKNIFTNNNLKIKSLNNFVKVKEPEEIGLSFAENAKIKSLYGFKNFNLPCFADDSGICIEALGWKPNIFSKRFINSFSSEKECLKKIIQKVKESKKDNAFFQTSICYTNREKYHIVFEGKVYGKISNKILGSNGFGYDPIFIPNGYKKTFAEMSIREKNQLSHRSIAINKLVNFLI